MHIQEVHTLKKTNLLRCEETRIYSQPGQNQLGAGCKTNSKPAPILREILLAVTQFLKYVVTLRKSAKTKEKKMAG